MVVLMGGKYSQGYQLFQSLTVKAFLAVRPYAEQIINTVQLMLDTGLPSFKGEPTIRRLKDRFTLHLNDRQAAEFMMGIIRNAHENVRSTAYDEFQRVSIVFTITTLFTLLRQLQNGMSSVTSSLDRRSRWKRNTIQVLKIDLTGRLAYYI